MSDRERYRISSFYLAGPRGLPKVAVSNCQEAVSNGEAGIELNSPLQVGKARHIALLIMKFLAHAVGFQRF